MATGMVNGNDIIGVLGGMGPGAGIAMSEYIVNNTIAGRDQDHLPQVLFSLPGAIYDRTGFLMGKVKTNPAFRMAEILGKMEKVGVHVAGIACNTAYAPPIFDVLLNECNKKGITIRLLHIVEEVGFFIQEYYPWVKKVGVLGTRGTFITRHYDLLQRDFGVQTVYLTEKEQQRAHLSVYHPAYGVKADPVLVSSRARQIFESSVASLKKRGAEAVILACTEFPMISEDEYVEDMPMVNSSLALARALIREHSPGKLKPWGAACLR